MSRNDLRRRAASGMKWTIGGRLLKSGLSVVTLAILARFLTPEEFGAVALILFVTQFAQMFVDAGLKTALVQRAEIDETDKSSVFWASMALALLLMGIVAGTAGPIVAAFGAEGIETYLRWMTLVFPISALQCLSATMLERSFAFTKIALIDIVAAVVGAITAISLVLTGAGLVALLAQTVVQAVVSTVGFLVLARGFPRVRFSWAALRRLLDYSVWMFLTDITRFLSDQLDRPIVAGVLSTRDLGYMTTSQQLVASPFRIIVQMARKVLFPMMASVQQELERVRRAYLQIQFSMAAIMMPACAGILAVAEPLVTVLLGEPWTPIAPIVQLVALKMAIIPLQQTNGMVLTALGHVRFQFWWTLTVGTIGLIAFAAGARWGVEAALAARLCVTLVNTPLLSFYTCHKIGLELSRLGQRLLAPAGAAAAMAAIVLTTAGQLDPYLRDYVVLAICVPLGVGIYVGLMLLFDRKGAVETTKLILQRG